MCGNGGTFGGTFQLCADEKKNEIDALQELLQKGIQQETKDENYKSALKTFKEVVKKAKELNQNKILEEAEKHIEICENEIKLIKEVKVRFDFSKAPLEKVLEFFKKSFGYGYVLSPGFEAELTFGSGKKVSFEEAYELFITALQSQGYTAILDRRAKILEIAELKEIDKSKLESILINDLISDEETEVFKIKKNSNEVVRCIVKLNSSDAVIAADQIEEKFNPPSWNEIKADRASNSLDIVCTKKFLVRAIIPFLSSAENLEHLK